MTGAQPSRNGEERRSLWSRVIRAFMPWSHRTRRADRADAETEAAIANAEDIHQEARRAITDARAVAGQYRAADERLGRMSGRR